MKLLRILLVGLLSLPFAAQAATAFWYEREATQFNPAFTRHYQAPTDTFQLVGATPGYLSVRVNYDNLEDGVSLEIAPPTGASFTLGAYEAAARAPFRGSAPGLAFTGAGGCNTVTGRFAVLELVLDGALQITSFAANFEMRCDGFGPRT